jgi:hypothetical protein
MVSVDSFPNLNHYHNHNHNPNPNPNSEVYIEKVSTFCKAFSNLHINYPNIKLEIVCVRVNELPSFLQSDEHGTLQCVQVMLQVG